MIKQQQPQPKIKLIEILYNERAHPDDDYDQFFSDFFCKKYEEKYREPLDVCEYIVYRNNPKVIEMYKIYEELCNHEKSRLKITLYPEELLEYILIIALYRKEYFHYDTAKLYGDFYREVMEENKPIEEVRPKYERIKYVIDCYNRKKIQDVPFDPTIFLSPTQNLAVLDE
jgi:hypothetical protein